MSGKTWLCALAAAVLLQAAAGTARAAFSAVDKTPYLDRPARFALHEMSEPPGTDPTVVIIINFAGQTLRGEGNMLRPAGEREGTLKALLASLQEPWRFNLHRVTDGAGRERGYVLCFENLEDGFTLYEGENLLLVDIEGGLLGEGMGGGAGGS